MTLTAKEIRAGTPEYGQVNALYEEAFPPVERIDIDLLYRPVKAGKAALTGYYDGEQLAAFSHVLLLGHYCYVLYAAIAPGLRHKGLIAEIVRLLRARYPDREIVFDIETPDERMENQAERLYRYAMFSHLGFRDTGFGMTDASGSYTIFSAGGFDEDAFRESWDILPEEFDGTEIIAL